MHIIDIHVLLGQRKERYKGEYGLEALTCMTEHDQENNPDYLPEQLEKYEATHEFDALAVVRLQVDEDAIRRVLFPADTPVAATVA